MIVLDTHIWVWWVHGDAQLPARHRAYLQAHETQGLGVSIISCWEVAKLVEYGRLQLPRPVVDWLHQALAYPHVRLLDLTPRIVVESTQLPNRDGGHEDPFVSARADGTVASVGSRPTEHGHSVRPGRRILGSGATRISRRSPKPSISSCDARGESSETPTASRVRPQTYSSRWRDSAQSPRHVR